MLKKGFPDYLRVEKVNLGFAIRKTYARFTLIVRVWYG